MKTFTLRHLLQCVRQRPIHHTENRCRASKEPHVVEHTYVWTSGATELEASTSCVIKEALITPLPNI
jgi:hypothetical protein